MPENQDNILDLSSIIKEVENLPEVVTADFAKINTPRALFIPVHELYLTELAGGEATPT